MVLSPVLFLVYELGDARVGDYHVKRYIPNGLRQ